ncbi:MAG: hypothetical protein CMJ18_19890 [Phycisphaeraceae bacterium]|nr:hypothetical protein [Phycisphaeraceae bacterium]
MKQIILLRHGVTRENQDAVIQGQTDGHLTEIGRRQGRAAGQHLSRRRIDRAVSSDLARARDTLTEVLVSVDVPWSTDVRLRERSFGSFHGRLRDDYVQAVRDSDIPAHTFRPPDGEDLIGEDYTMVHDRAASFLNEMLADPGDETVLVVTHGGIVRHMLAYAHRLPMTEVSRFETDNASITELQTTEDGAFEIVRMNDTSHLSDDPELAGPRLGMI